MRDFRASSSFVDGAHGVDRPAPGKRALTDAIQRRAVTAPDAIAPSSSIADVALAGMPTPDPFWFATGPVQALDGELDGEQPAVHAARGVSGSGTSLPFLEQIQTSFGRHDVRTVQAYTGGAAAEANAAIGAQAYATGNAVAFGGTPDLHTAAHEAAHVVQQRGGVQLAGGVGAAGDVYEQHADAVADRVVAGASAESLLDVRAGDGQAVSQMVQRKGDPPYRQELVLSTPFAKLSLKHPDRGRVEADEVGDYEIKWLLATPARPPVYQDGEETKQGQHKVAWVAITHALDRLAGQRLEDADAILDSIIAMSGVEVIDSAVVITPVDGARTPAAADQLLTRAHNYLCARQRDNPSWASTDKAQLKGKGERGLVAVLGEWQAVDATAKDARKIVRAMFSTHADEPSPMNMLLDTAGRDSDEADDAIARARRELQIHNPDAFAAFEGDIEAWLDRKRVEE